VVDTKRRIGKMEGPGGTKGRWPKKVGPKYGLLLACRHNNDELAKILTKWCLLLCVRNAVCKVYGEETSCHTVTIRMDCFKGRVGLLLNKPKARQGLGFGLGPGAWLFKLFSKSLSPILLNKHQGPPKARARSIQARFSPNLLL
jgi:hypothetical protein